MFFLFTILHNELNAQKTVYEFTIDQEIGPSMTKLSEKAMTAAKEAKADYILLILDTYGGALEDGDKIRTMFLKSEIPTLVFIKNNAASAGALISIACDSIYMSEGGTIGAACVVNQTGEMMPEKYQSYMRKKMRATAEGTGRNPLIAEGMADENLVIDGVKESGKIVSLTTDEAIAQGYCNAKVKGVDDVLRRLGNGYTIKRHEITATDNLVLFFLNPAVSGILLIIIFGGIFMEFKAPGSIFPIAIAGVAAVFYFVPLYLEGLADNWEIVIFFLGIILLLLEIFVIPGFGVAGITGIIFIIGGLALAMVRNVLFDFTFVPKGAFSSAVFLVAVSIAIPVVLILVFGKRIFESKALSWSAVKPDLKANEGFTVKESIMDGFVGMKAICHTDLRPQGKIEIGGEYYEANADGEFIEKGNEVIVKGVRNNYLVVHRSL
jgi:membrane-bound serine protease (ClpP class)